MEKHSVRDVMQVGKTKSCSTPPSLIINVRHSAGLSSTV